MDISKLCIAVYVSYMLSVSSVCLCQVCGLDAHSTSESFPDLNHPLSFSHSSLKKLVFTNRRVLRIWPQTGWLSGCYAHFPRLFSSLYSTILSFSLLHISLSTVNILFTSIFSVSRQFVIITRTWFAIRFPSKRMSPASNATDSPKHQCKQHFERCCTGKPNQTNSV